ncbi:DUF1638 domain-containing protein [Actinomadura barringtoniae]|uniref:DUF1638 domain-containing protein n=1 Tax=Actinomadura barringtoniae TaxID=1427535 RepID=A0A939TBE8_9ACTN|nr:DUF1638 domain-containing protein [Actinomadura barringtoniae]MBO2450100.1 DUF1638 domain-containing protein [Actinomadura barringtoniae]
MTVHALAPLLHNRPAQIPAAVEEQVRVLRFSYIRIAIAYADCGTYGALDEVCTRLNVPRLRGPHCYETFAGRDLLDDEPGTYILTDFLARSFKQTVVAQLGLDRYPELRDDYFRHYKQVLYLAQDLTPENRHLAQEAAAFLDLPLRILPAGVSGLESELERLLTPGSDRRP